MCEIDTDGTFPADPNAWEAEVLDLEHDRAGFVAWYRNPSRSSQDSLAVAYDHGSRIRTVRPDFVFFTKQPDGSIAASIFDPHGHHLGDALAKLRGLADYAERHGHHYQRIDAVAKIGDTLRVLDLTEPSVRATVTAATDANTLYKADVATDYQTAPEGARRSSSRPWWSWATSAVSSSLPAAPAVNERDWDAAVIRANAECKASAADRGASASTLRAGRSPGIRAPELAGARLWGLRQAREALTSGMTARPEERSRQQRTERSRRALPGIAVTRLGESRAASKDAAPGGRRS